MWENMASVIPPSKISANANKRLHIHFDNYGVDQKEKHWERIFQRFYRVDKSRDREAGGTGLGLAIVKHITFVHGGEIKVFSSENKKNQVYYYIAISFMKMKKTKSLTYIGFLCFFLFQA